MYDLNDAGLHVVPGGLSERRKRSGPGPVTAILKLLSGREPEILAALGITPSQRGHIRCPTPEHDDRNPSFRWDGKKFYCTCGSGDVLDLIVKMGRAHDASSAASWAKEVLGVHVVKPAPSRQPAPRRDPKFDIESILSGCKPLAGTEGETYLAGRGLNDPASPDLLFHADLTDFKTRRGYCGMVAIVRDGTGGPTGGIHRTFLADDGSGKAAPGRKMLGPVAGGSVQLRPILDDSLGIAEGIETALAVMQIFPGVSCWAALSADNVGRWELPPDVNDVTIYRDAGEAGEKAATMLAERLAAAGISCRIVAPIHGDDFNDDLGHGVKSSDYEAEEVGEVATPGNAEPKRKRHRPAKKKTEPETPREPEQIKHRFDANRIDGDRLLQEVCGFVRRFVVYPSNHSYVAHALWAAHAHVMRAWDNTPRLLFTSHQPGCGKSRCLEITSLLVPLPMEAFNVSAAYLVRKISGGRLPTILYDEVDALFGSGKASEKSEDVRAVINAGHRRGAQIGRCRIGEDGVETEELPAYCAVALAGLDRRLPDTITSRSIIIVLRRRAPHEQVEPFRRRMVEPEGHLLRDGLAAWTNTIPTPASGNYPVMPAGVTDRDADCWEALIAIADAAGGDWPTLARAAAQHFVEARSAARATLGIQLLKDVRGIFDAATLNGEPADKLFSVTIATSLVAMEEAPWGDLKGKALDERGLASMLRNFDVRSEKIRIGETVRQGYRRSAFCDAWLRYLPDLSGTSGTTEQE